MIARRTFAVAAMLCALATIARSQTASGSDELAGAWRGKVTFTSGMFASLKDLEYMYSFNVGGTMTESSNYDAVPPVPPAYGVWRKVGPRKYEAKYTWFQSKSIATSADLMKEGGWGPGGYGIIRQTITLSADGNKFTSTIRVEMFDNAGKAIRDGNGSGTAVGDRIRF